MNIARMSRAVRCATAGIMLAAVAVTFEASAIPFFTTDATELWIATSSGEDALSEGLARFALPIATDRLQRDLLDLIGRKAGFDDFPAGLEAVDARGYGDNGFRQGEGLLDPTRALANARGRPGAGPDFGHAVVIDGIMRSARESLLDENEAASISLAGIEVSASLRGDRRSLMINGYDLLPLLLQASRGDESWRESQTNVMPEQAARLSAANAEAAEAAPPAQSYRPAAEANMVAELRTVATHPLSLMLAFACVLMWLVARIAQVVRS